MAKVYLSSTVLDLQAERRAASDWLIAAGHQPVHSYVADSETVRDSCLADIAGCQLYLLLLGHRYGYVPEAGNPQGLSITHMEFRRAGELGLPRIALLRTSVPDIRHTDLLDPARNQRLQAFHAEVRQAVRPAEFQDEADLIAGLSTAIQRTLANPQPEMSAGPRPAWVAQSSSSAQTAPGTDAGNWWTSLPGLLTGGAALISAVTGLAILFLDRPDAPPADSAVAQVQPVPAPQAPVSVPMVDAQVPPRITLAGPAEASFEKYRPSTYTILGLETVQRTPEHYVLRLRVRLLTRTSMDMNFWDDSFRLLIDGLPTAPDSNLNELVPGNAARDAEVSFLVPYTARRLALRILHHQSLGDVAELPLALDQPGDDAARRLSRRGQTRGVPWHSAIKWEVRHGSLVMQPVADLGRNIAGLGSGSPVHRSG